MSKKRNIRVRGVRRAEPDLRKLSRALIALAQAQSEADAEALHRAGAIAKDQAPTPRSPESKERSS